MLMMPIIALLFFVVMKIVDKAHSLEELHALQGLSSFAVKIDALTHEMQKERALSSGFIGSQGERFQAKLFEQRRQTNEKVEKFKSSMNAFKVEEFGPQFQPTLNLVMDQLELISQYKSELLANMSHELRTPLNSLLILASLLASNDQGNLTDDQVESAKVIHSGGKDLLTLINDILDLSKVEAGHMDIHMEDVDLNAFLSGLQRQVNPVAQDKGIAFEVEKDSGMPPTVQTDGQRTEQILKNFLSNAFKFTRTGAVTVRVHVPDTDVQFRQDGLIHGKVVAFSVTDTGIGIPEEKQKAIFEAFQQADGSTCRNFGGTGLGLTISRELARLLGGEIQLQSRQGEGSTFTLFLPVEPRMVAAEYGSSKPAYSKSSFPEMSPNAIADAVQTQDCDHASSLLRFLSDDRDEIHEGVKSTLIIEDDIHFAKILMEITRKKGYKCLAAGDGTSGLQLTMAFKPNAIILDLGLPDIDGQHVLNQLKSRPDTKHIPVHILSGRDDLSDFLES